MKRKTVLLHQILSAVAETDCAKIAKMMRAVDWWWAGVGHPDEYDVESSLAKFAMWLYTNMVDLDDYTCSGPYSGGWGYCITENTKDRWIRAQLFWGLTSGDDDGVEYEA